MHLSPALGTAKRLVLKINAPGSAYAGGGGLLYSSGRYNVLAVSRRGNKSLLAHKNFMLYPNDGNLYSAGLYD